MTAKLRIKAKGIEIEWEGEVDYLKNDLPDLIAAIGSVPAWLSSRAIWQRLKRQSKIANP
jgi:hypothetical protein